MVHGRLSVQDAWQEHQQLVRWTTWRIIKRYGGDYEELFSEALVIFTRACHSFEPQFGSLSNWISFHVYKGLLEIKRTEARHLRITGPMLQPTRDIAATKPDYLLSLWKSLSTDSQQVLNLLFDLDLDSFKNKSLARLWLRKALRNLDFSNDKITACFREIEAALN